MSAEAIVEARRQVEICNACRYCEGYCSVFPAITRRRSFSDADMVQLANLCHNCRGCYYACQFTEPHEFKLNIPKAFAELRQETWQEHAVPQPLARVFHRSGVAIAFAAIVGFALLIWAVKSLGSAGGEGFYAVLSHNAMVLVFAPAFVLPLIAIALSVRSYWRRIGGGSFTKEHVLAAFCSASRMRDLAGGHGEGCNFEDDDRFSSERRWNHQLVMYGFLLCFAATSVATIMHYVFDMPAPYAFVSLPKLLGVIGGLALCIGTVGLAALKVSADRDQGDARVWGGEMAFILLLFCVSLSGLALYALGSSSWLSALLVIHLGTVLAFFLLMPYSKMVHGFFRLAALIADAKDKASTNA